MWPLQPDWLNVWQCKILQTTYLFKLHISSCCKFTFQFLFCFTHDLFRFRHKKTLLQVRKRSRVCLKYFGFGHNKHGRRCQDTKGCGYGWRKKRNCMCMIGCKHQSTVQNSCSPMASHPSLLDMMFIQYSCLLPVKFLSLFWSVMLYTTLQSKEGGWWTSKDWCRGLYR